MTDARTVSAVVVTRGDVDLSTILNSLPFRDVTVWDNSRRQNLQCYGRFRAVQEARHDLIYVQDDDLLVPVAGLLRAYDRRRDRGRIVANKPPEEEWRFLGCGAIFHRDLLDVFDQYLEHYPLDDDFLRACDVVFAYGTPYRSVSLGYLDFPWQTAANRMYKQPGHYTVRERLRDRTLALEETL